MLPNIVPVTEIKRNAAQVLNQLRKDKRSVLITEHGRAAAILLDVEIYEELAKRADILDRLIQFKPEIRRAMATILGDVSRMIHTVQAERMRAKAPAGSTEAALPSAP